jgi:hypothetical protein
MLGVGQQPGVCQQTAGFAEIRTRRMAIGIIILACKVFVGGINSISH